MRSCSTYNLFHLFLSFYHWSFHSFKCGGSTSISSLHSFTTIALASSNNTSSFWYFLDKWFLYIMISWTESGCKQWRRGVTTLLERLNCLLTSTPIAGNSKFWTSDSDHGSRRRTQSSLAPTPPLFQAYRHRKRLFRHSCVLFAQKQHSKPFVVAQTAWWKLFRPACQTTTSIPATPREPHLWPQRSRGQSRLTKPLPEPH